MWTIGEKRNSYTEEIYKASIVFDRDDLRYIGFNGLRLSNAYPPKLKKFDFKALGLFIIRTKWNHNYCIKTVTEKNGIFSPESMQITYNNNLKMLSISVGPLTQLLFKSSKAFESINDLDDCFEFTSFLEGENYNYLLEFENCYLELINISTLYKITKESDIKSQNIFYYKDDFWKLRNTFDIKIEKSEKNNIKNITFNVKEKK